MSLGSGKWICASPTLDVYVSDFTDADMVPLERDAPFPLEDRPHFAFDRLSDAELQRLRATASNLHSVLGGGPAVPIRAAGADWYYADPANEKFGENVEDFVMLSQSTVTRGGMALAEQRDAEGNSWAFIEHVASQDKPEWLSDKREGAGRDPRLLPLPALPEGRGYSLKDALAVASTVPGKFRGFNGPSSAKEILAALVASGLEPAAYCAQFEVASGLAPKSALAHELRMHFTSLVLAIGVDRTDPHQSAAIEHICRRIVQIQKAVRRCAKSPDFEGLEAYMRHTADPGLALAANDFEAHISTVLKDERIILKETRLTREEQVALAKRKADK